MKLRIYYNNYNYYSIVIQSIHHKSTQNSNKFPKNVTHLSDRHNKKYLYLHNASFLNKAFTEWPREVNDSITKLSDKIKINHEKIKNH